MAEKDTYLSKYISEINRYPILTREQEVEIARRIHQGDEDALQEMVKSNLRFVISISKKYLGSGFPLADIINEGTIGLIEAAKRFDPDRGVKFITYAVWWIRQAILYAIANKSGIVKIPPSQAHMLHMINKRIQSMTQLLGREPLLSELAADIGRDEKEIEMLMRTARTSLSVEGNIDEDDHDGMYISLSDENSFKAEEQVIEDSFVDDVELLLECLDDREKEILKLHYGFVGSPLTLQQIGDKYKLTRERIRQIEARAIKKLKRVASNRNLHDYLE